MLVHFLKEHQKTDEAGPCWSHADFPPSTEFFLHIADNSIIDCSVY